MRQTTVTQQQEQIAYPNLPLAVYRELAAHLQQIEGVTTELIPQQSEQFDYAQSQVETLLIQYPSSLDILEKHQIQIILDYYAKIHGAYERR
ncbi:MAG: hypothetical protein ACTMUB_00905 [cyanobacterium endosymbiont of Rhopalodia musculus]|uniref:hypothetical protein n=1 Tax=cyanobacterium endosymbiont of Epithemia clementina EcSB TaxID=3034674 RepID=UPI002480D5D4|nr:hypothetical protein [cyanobacterium endosymbiont of Epithemia clementina EcSB]WGT66828.1 hypothetical protein P3F56_06115 [cyanobacterium endosymbiont of Epithemia clementina EcSB]